MQSISFRSVMNREDSIRLNMKFLLIFLVFASIASITVDSVDAIDCRASDHCGVCKGFGTLSESSFINPHSFIKQFFSKKTFFFTIKPWLIAEQEGKFNLKCMTVKTTISPNSTTDLLHSKTSKLKINRTSFTSIG